MLNRAGKLNEFEAIGLLHFHKGIWPSHVAEFPFQKLMHIWKDTFLYKKKADILMLKVIVKNLYYGFCTTTQYFFIPDSWDVGEEWNQGDIIEIF